MSNYPASSEGVAQVDDDVRDALSQGHTIDITTTGRRTGEPRRIEIVFHVIDGRIFISGTPRNRTRAWIYNLEADPHLTFHLKGQVTADLPATARVITDDAERRRVSEWIATNAWKGSDVEAMVAASPLIEVTIEAAGA
jgi:deazaflavin-dependent oxidoreductase (nitroreductase family)